ncbi:prolipoprotein diacylglyceryl transferase [Candidatus Woesearchaeota archaeon]|nr:prolipoprotein diacylglyceryl transferase [Candidatus Woesearchaeota archaeon]
MTWVHSLDPVLLHLGPLQIRWYGLMYVLAFLFAYWYVRREIRQGRSELTLPQLDSLLTLSVIGLLVGARVFYVLIYNASYYAAHPLEVFAVWAGGLSFHGGLFGGLIAGWLFCRTHKLSFLKTADLFIVPVALGQAFGRLGNFINGELPGRITSLWWGVKFPNVEGFRHPSSLYEAAYDILIFSVLYPLRTKQWRPGSLLALFLMMYAAFRFVTEFVREPEIMIGPLTMGQLLNIPMFIAGAAIWYATRQKAEAANA